MINNKKVSPEKQGEFISLLKARFEKNNHLHEGVEWAKVNAKLELKPGKLWSLYEMERTGGEPCVIEEDIKSGEFIFYDCSLESPKGRRSICYDQEALNARKENKPIDSAMNMANNMGIELLSEEEYRKLQYLITGRKFDLKTSSWIQTPSEIRKLGGALFCDCRYDTVFVYHNGAESYYAARGFRGSLRL